MKCPNCGQPFKANVLHRELGFKQECCRCGVVFEVNFLCEDSRKLLQNKEPKGKGDKE